MTHSARFRFELTGPGAGSYDIVCGGGEKAMMEPASDKRQDVIVGCDTQIFALLVYGRLRFEEAVAARQIFVSGDAGLISQFGR